MINESISLEKAISKIIESGDVWVFIIVLIIVLSFKYVVGPSMDLFRETITFYNSKCLELITKLNTDVDILSRQVTSLSEKIDEVLEETRRVRMG